MTERPWHPSDGVPSDIDTGWDFEGTVEELFHDAVPAIGSQPGDCCSASPAFRIVLPPTEARTEPAELLLCGHHCRVARDALTRAGAAVYDSMGRSVTPAREAAEQGAR